EYAGVDAKLKSDDEVALLPPVSGGAVDSAGETPAAQPARGQRYAVIVRERIDTQALIDKIKQPEDGADVVFEGVVRNQTSGPCPSGRRNILRMGRFGRVASRSRPRFPVPEAPNLGSVHLNRRTNLSARFAANLCNRCR